MRVIGLMEIREREDVQQFVEIVKETLDVTYKDFKSYFFEKIEEIIDKGFDIKKLIHSFKDNQDAIVSLINSKNLHNDNNFVSYSALHLSIKYYK